MHLFQKRRSVDLHPSTSARPRQSFDVDNSNVVCVTHARRSKSIGCGVLSSACPSAPFPAMVSRNAQQSCDNESGRAPQSNRSYLRFGSTLEPLRRQNLFAGLPSSVKNLGTPRWASTFASKVNLHRTIECRALCGANLVTR